MNKGRLVSYLVIGLFGLTIFIKALSATDTSNEITKFECQLYNDYYTGEHLYAESDKLKMHRHIRFVHTWKLGNKTTTEQLQFNAKDTKAIWQLIAVKQEAQANTFLIRNVKFDEYLFASDDGTHILRRKVCTKWSPVTSMIVECLDQPAAADLPKCKKKHMLVDKRKMWIISPNTFGNDNVDKSDEEKEVKEPSFRKVTIYNSAFGEAMYAPSVFRESATCLVPGAHVAQGARLGPVQLDPQVQR